MTQYRPEIYRVESGSAARAGVSDGSHNFFQRNDTGFRRRTRELVSATLPRAPGSRRPDLRDRAGAHGARIR